MLPEIGSATGREVTALRGKIRLGHRFGERVEVLAGLAAGETVVTDPLAASAALVASREPGHE